MAEITADAEGVKSPDESAFDEVLEWLRHLNVHIPEPAPVAMRYTSEGMVDIPVEMATEDDLVIHPDRADLEDLAHAVIGIVRDCHETFPGKRNWRRWDLTRKVASFLYCSGITSNGGSSSMSGRDPHHTMIHTLPSFNLHHRRPYILWKMDWWWECHWRQGLRIRGRHRPAHPFAFGVCARCMPCPNCGEPYDCKPGCDF